MDARGRALFVRWGRCKRECGADGGVCPQSQLLKPILCAELRESKQAARMGVEVETITPGDGKMHHRWNRIDNIQTAILISQISRVLNRHILPVLGITGVSLLAKH